MKICSACKELKEIGQFNKDKYQKSGIRSHCKNCVSLYGKNRKDKIRKSKHIHVEYKHCYKCKETKHRDEFHKCFTNLDGLDKICKECASARDKSKYQNNKEEERQRSKDYRKKNRERARESSKSHYENNKEYYLERNRKRKAKKLGATIEPIPREFFDSLYAAPSCSYCERPFDGSVLVHAEHIIPLSRGGSHSMNNLTPACASCNLSKHDSLLVEWKDRPQTVGSELIMSSSMGLL